MSSRLRAILAVGVLAVLLGGVGVYSLVSDELTATVLSTDPASEYQSPPLEAPGGGVYAFMATQPETDDVPVTYDPCETIQVVVNEERVPSNGDDLLADALEEMEELTGLSFELVGTTRDEPLSDDIERGDGWRPVQVSWSDEDGVPELAGSVAGLGGSTWVEQDGVRHFVTGDVVLDAGDLDELGDDYTRTVLLHELGHLVGLAHVDSTDELMHPFAAGEQWGPGDLVGLQALGQGPCR